MSRTKTKSSQTQNLKPKIKSLKLDGDEILFQHVRIQIIPFIFKIQNPNEIFELFSFCE